MNKNDRKLDLLQDCHDPGMGMNPREFMATFCKRCRNGGCVNAGWSESKWEDRMSTQVSRLLTNPVFGDPSDPSFKNIRSMVFREVSEPLVLSRSDPWEPQVHLAEQPKETAEHPEVERAISALAEARGRKPPAPARAIQASEPVSPQELLGGAKDAVQPPVPASPSASPTQPSRALPVQPQAKANPRHFQDPASRQANTEFPAEGMMVDGGPPPVPGTPSPGGDPWTPPASNAPRKVAVGAKVKMGG